MKTDERLRRLLRENLGVKALAFGLAVVVIILIQRITNRTEEFEVAIQVSVPNGVAVLQQDARFAYVTCRGSLDDLRRMDAEQLELSVTPRSATGTGTEIIPIGPRNVSGAPRSVTVVNVRPGLLNLTLDREIEREVSVARPEVAGRPVLGRAEVEFSPRMVTVRGPQQIINDLRIMRTGPIDVENASVSFTKELPIIRDDDAGLWEVIPAKISVRVNIVTEAINREWNDLPIMILRNPDTDLVFQPEPQIVSLNVLGSPQAVNRIATEAIRVFIDCTTIREPGTYSLPASAQITGGPDVSSAINPSQIKVVAVRLSLPAPVEKPEETEAMAPLPNASKDPAE